MFHQRVIAILLPLLISCLSCNAQSAGGAIQRKTNPTAPARKKPAAPAPRKKSSPSAPSAPSRRQTRPNTSNNGAKDAEKARAAAGIINNMVYVPGGTFTMGATSEQGIDAWDDETPTHIVSISGFHIGRYEVTQKEWKAIMGTNPSVHKGDNRPVENVSWDDCQAFIRKLNALTGRKFRLPTEAEWEYAARGGNQSIGYKYAGSSSIDDVAWYGDNSGTYYVGQKSSNELGLYDMSGNVWEWCQDWYTPYDSSRQSNPSGPTSGSMRVYRGGSWCASDDQCRVSTRGSEYPGEKSDTRGLRLAY